MSPVSRVIPPPPPLSPATAKFISISNVLGGIRSFDRETLTGLNMRSEAVSSITASRRPVRLPKTLDKTGARRLRIAWQTELAARVSDQLDDEMLRRVAAQTLPVQTYYAVFNAARAATGARGTACNTHSAVHRDFQAQCLRHGHRSWGVALRGDPDNVGSCVLEPTICTPSAFNPMELSRAPEEYVFAALRMTRRWKFEEQRAIWLKSAMTATGARRKRLPAAERVELVAKLRPTTILDFLYELRARTNYEGVEEYGSDSDDFTVEQFHRGLLHVADMGMLHYETDLAVTVGVSAYESEVNAWIKSTARIGSWARDAVERRLRHIKAGCPTP